MKPDSWDADLDRTQPGATKYVTPSGHDALTTVDQWVLRRPDVTSDRWCGDTKVSHHRRPWTSRHLAGFNIVGAVESLAEILSLPADFDGQGSRHYQKNTTDRALNLLLRLNQRGLALRGKSLPTPEILPGPDGGVDIHWTEQKFELLMHVPENATNPVTFYGDNYRDIKLKGKVDPLDIDDSLLRMILLQ